MRRPSIKGGHVIAMAPRDLSSLPTVSFSVLGRFSRKALYCCFNVEDAGGASLRPKQQ
jgi:hypothetical protein